MQTEYFVTIEDFCANYNVELSFVETLQQSGLIEVVYMEDSGVIEAEQIPQLEKFIRLYYDLDINIEGIETINHLLERINTMQSELNSLRNRLRLYEINENL